MIHLDLNRKNLNRGCFPEIGGVGPAGLDFSEGGGGPGEFSG
jgi:hypothetical protein